MHPADSHQSGNVHDVNNGGRVFLVGAGPGDPELLTVKAERLLREAEVVVYDRLVSEDLLELIPAGVSRIYVGKQPGRQHVPQEEINRMLVRLARSGHRVVRLKGGDPFVFGRGGEEALHLARHGVPYEIVPGVTAAMACAAYAGIPVTHRGLARGVQLITGHCQAGQPLDLDWQALVSSRSTLVVYMGLANLVEIRDGLIGAGMNVATPAAVIENGTTRAQRRIITTLGALAESVANAGVTAPALFIIGDVVSLATELDWFAESPSQFQPPPTEIACSGG
jgi:uroporphyrin-III C-methyltransferase/precorrin-2 dehydrogenase/sirohydrochlorin ferrochelatase/uroporphyrin-III C-methyltransferase